MRVTLVSNMYAYPGNWDKLDALGKAVELQVITPRTWATDRELHPMARVPRYSGDAWSHEPLPTIGQGNPFRYFYHLRPLVHAIRRFRPELVHVEQEPESLALLQLSALKVPLSYRLIFVAWEIVNPLRLGWGFRLVNFALADGAIFGNDAARRRAGRLGYRGTSVVVPQYGFDVAHAASHNTRHGPFTIGFAGRLVAEKGITTLLQAVDLAQPVNLVVAGDGPLEDEVAAHPRVRWLGKLQRTGMDDFWDAIDVLVLPSITTRIIAEQFGRVLVEAMARQIPVIGSSAGAIPEVIGDAGLVFPEGDSIALADAIRALRDNPSLMEELRVRGFSRAQTLYSHEVVTQKTVDFYGRVLGRS